MNTEDAKPKRQYASRLRESQAGQTRARILEALAEQIGDAGRKDFSIERVALRAGVSPRTVYHHFPNRDELLDGVTLWLDEQATGRTIEEALTADELLTHIGVVFEAFDQQESLIRAHLVTELGQAVRRRGRSRRPPVIEAIVRQEAPGAPEAEVRSAVALIHYLTSSEAWRSMKDESGMTGRDAGQAVAWAIHTLLADLSKKARGSAEVEKGESNGSR